jgi:hypothetical protein
MGWRFRKTFSRGPFRTTVSKRGIGWSWGIPGLRYGVSPSGRRYISASIPGTGFSWIKYLDGAGPGPLPGGTATGLPPAPSPAALPPPAVPPAANVPPAVPPAAPVPWWKQKDLLD